MGCSSSIPWLPDIPETDDAQECSFAISGSALFTVARHVPGSIAKDVTKLTVL